MTCCYITRTLDILLTGLIRQTSCYSWIDLWLCVYDLWWGWNCDNCAPFRTMGVTLGLTFVTYFWHVMVHLDVFYNPLEDIVRQGRCNVQFTSSHWLWLYYCSGQVSTSYAYCFAYYCWHCASYVYSCLSSWSQASHRHQTVHVTPPHKTSIKILISSLSMLDLQKVLSIHLKKCVFYTIYRLKLPLRISLNTDSNFVTLLP